MDSTLSHYDKRMQVFESAVGILEAGCSHEKLTIKSICKASGISRATFYRLFSGTNGLFLWHQRYTAKVGLHEIGRTLTCKEGHTISLVMLTRAYPLHRHFSQNWSQEFYLSSVNNHVEAMSRVLKEEHGMAIDKRVKYELVGIAEISTQLVKHWFTNGQNIPLDEMVDIICSFIPKRIRLHLDRPTRR